MTTMGVHIHVHGEDSALDGTSTVKDLVKKAKSLGFPALGLTDHGVCGGIPEFIKTCEMYDIKPIPGCEVYTTQDRLIKGPELEKLRIDMCVQYKVVDKKGKPKMKAMSDFLRKMRKNFSLFEQEAYALLKDYLMEEAVEEVVQGFDLFGDMEQDFNEPSTALTPEQKIENFKKDVLSYLDKGNFHMILLAINNQGLENLYAIVSDAHCNGFYKDPRTDLAYIRERGLGNGLVATTACLGSWFSKLCLAGRLDEARAFIQECKETFSHFYLEKQATEIPDQLIVNRTIDQLAIETNTPKILSTDVHYANKEDYHIHDIAVTASQKKCLSDKDRLIYAHEFWMKSDEEMMGKCYDPEAWGNTLKIAEMANVSFPKDPLFPLFPVEEGDSVETILRKRAWEGLYKMAVTEEIDIDRYSKQLQYELDVICSEGFADYFLIEEDMITATVNAGYLVGPGRGSGAGSLVCRVMEITWLDPIKNGLLFERFLNPERAGYPDIDVDYGIEGALWVQHYLKRKYGHDRVAQIGTKGTLAARAACRKLGKTLGYDLATQDAFAKAIPERPGVKLKEAFAESETVRTMAETYPQWWEAMLALEGHVSSVSTHASGVVISPVPITNVTPIRLDSDNLETTQFDMAWIEKLLVKFDILKIDTLDLIKKVMEFAGLWGKMNIYRDIDVNDPKIYENIYQKLNLSGIFQCESNLFKKIIDDMKPTSFEDISVIVALNCPGYDRGPL